MPHWALDFVLFFFFGLLRQPGSKMKTTSTVTVCHLLGMLALLSLFAEAGGGFDSGHRKTVSHYESAIIGH